METRNGRHHCDASSVAARQGALIARRLPECVAPPPERGAVPARDREPASGPAAKAALI